MPIYFHVYKCSGKNWQKNTFIHICQIFLHLFVQQYYICQSFTKINLFTVDS